MTWTQKANLKGAPGATGPQGPQGLPGTNAVPADTAVAGYLATEGTSESKTAATGLIGEVVADLTATAGSSLNLAYAPVRDNTLNGFRVVVQGDSLTQSFDSTAGPFYRSSWFMLACALSGGRLRPQKNAAHGGYNSPQLQALFDSEVLAQNPTLVGLMPGRNDGQADGTPADMIAYVTEAVQKCRGAGVGIFLVNTVPQGTAALAAPSGVIAQVASTSSGSLPVGTHRYVVTAGNGSAVAQTGETTASTPAVVTTSSIGSVRISWPRVPGANWYKIYKETSDGSGVYGLIATVAPSASPGFQGNLRYIQQAAITSGAAAPTTNTTAVAGEQQANRARINAWLAQYAAKEGIPLVDVYSLLVDSPTGLWKTGYTYDGTHPVAEANEIIAQAVVDTLTPLLKPATPIIVTSAEDPVNLYDNGTFAANNGLLPTGFTIVTSPTYDSTLITTSVAARTGFTGNVLQVSASASAVATITGPTISTGITEGDILLFTAKVETDFETGGNLSVALKTQTGTGMTEHKFVDITTGPTVVTSQVTVPAGATGVALSLTYAGISPAYIGQVTLYNLTTQSYLNV